MIKCKDCPAIKHTIAITPDQSLLPRCSVLNQALLRYNVRTKIPGNCPLYNWHYKLVHTW